MHVLTITNTGEFARTTELHLLNPGECFPSFGGSSRGLVVRKTASLITRTRHPDGCVYDIERDIHDPAIWAWLSRLLNDNTGITTAVPAAKAEA